ncbi:hypothetical protein ABE28_011335 [Peribacillus muralis]|uniref:Uncharacterized protein n=1 Tax=Peribacillus muralis TaxID=264697 RepID=A0A1B3XNZ8_9BACI|nr:hypothetical protein ABE28_011335 [Peribacillus muralis]
MDISTFALMSPFYYSIATYGMWQRILKEDMTLVDERYKKTIKKLTICLMISQSRIDRMKLQETEYSDK